MDNAVIWVLIGVAVAVVLIAGAGYCWRFVRGRKQPEEDPSTRIKFPNRAEAGKALAQALANYRGQNPIVLGIPKGGAETAWQVKQVLGAQWSFLITHKLMMPGNEKVGIGAITEDGTSYVYPRAEEEISSVQVSAIKDLAKMEIQRLIGVFRAGAPVPPLQDRVVILVDDAIFAGLTMRVSIESCRKRGAQKVIVAAPAGVKKHVKELEELADDVVVLKQPQKLSALSKAYEEVSELSDDDVLAIIRRRQ